MRYVRIPAALRRWSWTTNDWWRVPALSTDYGRRGEEKASVYTPEYLRPQYNVAAAWKTVFDFFIDQIGYHGLSDGERQRTVEVRTLVKRL